jgi:hypothetical protein
LATLSHLMIPSAGTQDSYSVSDGS